MCHRGTLHSVKSGNAANRIFKDRTFWEANHICWGSLHCQTMHIWDSLHWQPCTAEIHWTANYALLRFTALPTMIWWGSLHWQPWSGEFHCTDNHDLVRFNALQPCTAEVHCTANYAFLRFIALPSMPRLTALTTMLCGVPCRSCLAGVTFAYNGIIEWFSVWQCQLFMNFFGCFVKLKLWPRVTLFLLTRALFKIYVSVKCRKEAPQSPKEI